MKRCTPYTSPEHLFLLFALVFGLAFTFLLPPLAGPDEYFHFQRIVSIANGTWLNKEAQVPAGIERFMQVVLGYQTGGTLLPSSAVHWYELAAIPLGADSKAVLEPSYMTIHSFVNYLPQSAMVWLLSLFNASPLTLLYSARLTGLSFSVFLTFHAIRIIPSWRYGFCALALLPPLEFYRVCLSADTVTTALGLLFISRILQEIVRTGPIKRAALLRLCVLGFLFPFCKLPYLAANFMCLAISRKRFMTSQAKLFWCLLIVVPGAIAGAWWMETARQGLFTGLHYETWGGKAFPDWQVAFMESNRLAYGMVVLRTVFSFSFYGSAVGEMFGHFGTMAQENAVYYGVLMALLGITLWMDGTSVLASYSLKAKLLTLPVAALFLLLTLTALYIHWNGVGAETIKGFQGRYVFPLLPLMLIVLPFRGRSHAQVTSAIAVGMFALVGLSLTVPVLLAHWK